MPSVEPEEVEHTHGPQCGMGDQYCPDRIQDEILIETRKDMDFWGKQLGLVSEQITINATATPLLQEIAAQAPPPRTLREILFSHRALATATAEQITDLMAELKPLFRD